MTKRPKLRRIVQRDGTACGVACAAMLTGRTYGELKQTIRAILGPGTRYWTEVAQLRRALREYGVEMGRETPFRGTQRLRDVCLLAVQWNHRKFTFHWVVYVPDHRGGYILDPRRSVKRSKRRDVMALRPKWVYRVRGRGLAAI